MGCLVSRAHRTWSWWFLWRTFHWKHWNYGLQISQESNFLLISSVLLVENNFGEIHKSQGLNWAFPSLHSIPFGLFGESPCVLKPTKKLVFPTSALGFYADLRTNSPVCCSNSLHIKRITFSLHETDKTYPSWSSLNNRVRLVTCKLRKMAARFSGLKIPPDCIGK